MTADEIFEESKEFYNKKFINTRTDKEYRYIGILIDDEDYYYAMYSKENGLSLLSCVGNIEDHGYKLNEH